MQETAREPGRIVSTRQRPQWTVAHTGYLRQHIHDMGLLPRLLIAESLVFVMLFAGGVYLIGQMAATFKDNIRQERSLLGRSVAEDLDTSLAHSVSELNGLAERYQQARLEGDAAAIQEIPDMPVGESAVLTGGILIAGAGGKVLAASQGHPELADVDMHRYWPDLWDRGGKRPALLTAGFRMEGQANPLVAIAIPVKGVQDDEYVIGLLDTANSYPAHTLARAVRFGNGGHADIVDRNGIALFSTQPEHVLLTSDHPADYQRLIEEGKATIGELSHAHEEEGAPEDEPHLMAFLPLQSVPWAISFGDTVSAAFAPVHEFWVGGLGFMSLFIGLAFAATVFVGRRLVQPVRTLSLTAREMAADRAVTVRFPWGGEIGELGRSLETMRLRLQARGAELEEQVRERTVELEERNRELRALYETLQNKEEQLRTLLTRVLSAQEDERRRVSRELHDEVGQALTVLSWGLEALEKSKPEQWPHLGEHIERLKVLATDTLDDLRRLVIALRPAALDDLGLVPAIRRYGELYLEPSGVDFRVQEDGPSFRLDPTLESVIYRVVQEAINNIARHSKASQVRVRLHPSDGVFAVLIEDNGQGFDKDAATSRRSGGLQGMEERASMVGGKLTIDSQPGRGTKVRVEIPLSERARRRA